MNAPFKKALCAQWEDWFGNREKEHTNKGCHKRPSYQQILDFVEQAVSTLNKETIKCAFECYKITAGGQTVKSDLLNSRLQSVLLGLESEHGGDDKERAEESDLEITTDNKMHAVVNSDNEVDLCKGFVNSDM